MYRIATADNFYDLEIMVSDWMNQGYQPIGGVAIDTDNFGRTLWAQAMILPPIDFSSFLEHMKGLELSGTWEVQYANQNSG